MRWRTIKKSPYTGDLDRAEVRAAIITVAEDRKAARSGSPVQEACAIPNLPNAQPLPGEVR